MEIRFPDLPMGKVSRRARFCKARARFGLAAGVRLQSALRVRTQPFCSHTQKVLEVAYAWRVLASRRGALYATMLCLKQKSAGEQAKQCSTVAVSAWRAMLAKAKPRAVRWQSAAGDACRMSG
jgi:hypothetical protein